MAAAAQGLDAQAAASACLTADGPQAEALVAELAGTASATPAGRSAARRQLAWALKEAGYAALYADLALASRAAVQIRALLGAERAGDQEPAESGADELAALADWMDGAVAAARGEAALALERLAAAEQAFTRRGQEAPAASCQVPMVAALSMLGRHEDAVDCGSRALARLAAWGDERAAGRVEINLGSMLLRLHRYAESAAHYRRAAVRLARAQDRRMSVAADIGLAGALSWQHEFDEALRIYDRAEARARAHGLHTLLVVIHASRGLLELHRERYAAALQGLESALAVYEREGPPQRLAEARIDLASAYLALNLLPEAQTLLELAVADGTANAAPVERAWATAHLALTLARRGRLAGARQRLDEARSAFAGLGNAVGSAWLELHAAALALRSGEPAQALPAARAAREALAAAGMRGWQMRAMLIEGQALAALGQPQAGAVLDALRERTQDLPELQAEALAALGRLRLRDGGSQATNEAARHFDAAATLIEQQQALLSGEEFRTAYGSDKELPFDALVGLALDEAAGRSRPAEPAWPGTRSSHSALDGPGRRLLVALERQRARALRLALAQPGGDGGVTRGARHPGEGDGARGVADGADTLRARLHWLAHQAQQALAAGDAERSSRLQQQLLQLEAAALESHRRAHAARGAESPGHEAAGAQAGLDPARIAPALAVLGQRAGGEAAVVVYAWLGERLAAVLLRGSQVQVFELDGQGLGDRIEKLRFQLQALRFGAGALRQHLPQMNARAQAHLEALHAQLWAPLAGALEGVDQVVVVPHRGLHYLPFCALHDGQQALLDRHALSLAPSLGLWLDGLETPAPAADAPGSPARAARPAVVLGMGGAHLPQVRAEVAAVAQACGPAAVVLEDEAATVQRLRQALAPAPGSGGASPPRPAGGSPSVDQAMPMRGGALDVLHLACHGQFRADSPYFSSLQLADGALTLRDAATLPLGGRLVTLSACETGLSRMAPGDELLGLVRAFLVGGAAGVVATLWTVEDTSTAALMADLYRGMRGGRTVPAALREAQRAGRERNAHPNFWAPFVHHGRG